MASSLVPEEDSGTSGWNKGTEISTLRSGNCSRGGEAGCEELDSVSSIGRVDGDGITVVGIGASGAGSRVLPGQTERWSVPGWKDKCKMLGFLTKDNS
jgi:hypothetical protein